MRNVTRAEALIFREHARESARAIKDALAREDWHIVGQEAILGTISANDALLGLKHGLVSATLNHRDAVTLLRQYERSDGGKKNSARFDRMLSKKRLVMYEGREITASEARHLASDAEAFLTWVDEETREFQP